MRLSFFYQNRFALAVWILLGSMILSSCFEDIACEIENLFLKCVTGDPDCNGDDYYTQSAPTSDLIFEANSGAASSDANLTVGPRYTHIASGQGHRIAIAPGEAAFEFPHTRLQLGSRVRAIFAGARTDVPAQVEPLAGRVNYFIGDDPKQWRTDVPTASKVRFDNVYPGIDVVYYGQGGKLEHDFVVAAGADPSQIRMRFDGADDVTIDSHGDIAIRTQGRTLLWSKPVLYQKAGKTRQRVEGRFDRKPDGTIGFEIGVYDLERPLVIDPVVSFATFVGRAGSEFAARIATDAQGNVYTVGGTSDVQFPVTPGSPSGVLASASLGDVTVTKVSADGKTLMYSTHLGGVATDLGFGIALDAAGNIYITGGTASSDYPVTSNAFQPRRASGGDPNSAADCFVTKLNPAGNALVYSTYLSGNDQDVCTGIGVDGAGNAYVTGATLSRDFPTLNAFQQNMRGSGDAFVTKLSADGSKLLYSTYMGGSGSELSLGIAVDSTGNVYLAGATTSNDFPVTQGAFQTRFGGSGGQPKRFFTSGDGFVMKLGPDGSQVYSTYLGGTRDDIAIGIAVDPSGAASVVGSTLSTDFPLLKPFQATFKGSGGDDNYIAGDAFVAKLNPQGSALVYSSYLGGAKDDRAMGIAVDSAGNAHVSGNTLSPDFPVTPDATQKTYAGELQQNLFHTGDAFFAQIDTNGLLTYANYVGGKYTDWSAGVALDRNGGAVMAGGTNSTDFPTTAGVTQKGFGGVDIRFGPAGDAFLVRFTTGTALQVSISGYANSASYATGGVAPGELVTITGTNIGPATLANAVYDVPSGKYNTLVAGTRFLFDGVAAPVYYVSATQSAVVVPYEVAGKSSTQLIAETNGIRSAPITIPVVASIPGLFSLDSSGRGQGVVFNEDGSLNSASNPAAKGSIIVFFGTGEGQTTPAGVTGGLAKSPYPRPVLPVSVTIGGVTTDPPAYAASVPEQLMGEFQVNVRVPATAPSGSVPVVVTIGSASSLSSFTAFVR